MASTAIAIPIFEANKYGCGILCVCFLTSMRSVQCGLITARRCNSIADWTMVLGKIPIASLALATSQLATTDLLERSHQPGLDFIFSLTLLVFKVAFSSLQ